MHLKGWGTPADITQAVAFFGMSSRAGNLLAAYNLAVLHLREMAGEKGAEACASAVGLLKRVAERGWPVLAEAADDFTMGDYEWALLNYLKASEWGSELGQSNAAWMLLDGYGYDGPRAGETAVSLLKRAAEQGNTAALVHIGDSYWYGKGVPRDWDKAGRVYAEAAKHREGQALFNLGYMHQYGAGVPKDFHLAKRYYDRAAEASPDGSFAVALALGVMRLHAWWDRVEPSLPRRWAWLWKDLLVVKQSDGEVGAIKAHASAPHGVLGRARRLFSLGTVIDLLDALDSSFNATLVTWLVGALVLVLLRRQAVRARQQGRPQVPPMVPQAPVQPAPVPAPAAEEVPATAPATTPPQQQPEEREEERLPAERLPEANVLRDGPSDGNTDA